MSASLFGNFLTVGSIPLLILLIIIYYSKDQFNTTRNQIFKMILISTLVYAFTEVLFALLVKYEAAEIWIEISTKIHFTISVLWWGLFVIYSIVLFEGINEDKMLDVIKYNKNNKNVNEIGETEI